MAEVNRKPPITLGYTRLCSRCKTHALIRGGKYTMKPTRTFTCKNCLDKEKRDVT